MANYALIRDSRIVNVVVVEPDTDQGKAYLAAIGPDFDAVIDTASWSTPGGPGQYVDANNQPIPYPALTVDPASIPGDGSVAATVSYTNGEPTAPGSVIFTVNGADSDPVPLASGVAELDVTASAPGPINVTCEGLTITIEAT